MAVGDTRRILSRLLTGLTLISPVALHLLIVSGYPRPGLGLVALVGLVHATNGVTGRRFATAAAASAVAFFCVYSLASGGHEALFLPPILISLGLLILFGRSLQSGREPMVTRFARILMNESDPATQRYTRKVTWVWTIFFALMVGESVLLAFFAPLAVWSLFTNVLNYLFIAGLFAIELAVRLFLFREHSVTRFLHALRKTDLRTLSGAGRRP